MEKVGGKSRAVCAASMDVRASPRTRNRVEGCVCSVLIEGIGTVVASELEGTLITH